MAVILVNFGVRQLGFGPLALPARLRCSALVKLPPGALHVWYQVDAGHLCVRYTFIIIWASRGVSTQARVRKQQEKNIPAFGRLAKFGPYVAGDSFTQADCATFVSLPLGGIATKVVLGEDLLASAGVDYKPYIKLMVERPSGQKVVADRKATQMAP